MTGQRPTQDIRTRLALSALACAFALPATGALARPAPADGVVADACQSVVRVQPGTAQYDGCVESLSGSLAGIGQGRAMMRAHDACLEQGLKPGTPGLAECTLSRADTQPASEAIKASDPAAPRMQTPGGARSWFSVSRGDQGRRQQLACARVGLDPTSAAFDSCVAGLRATLFELDNPSN
jgi:hypothetical protein